jgi:hypothetical protein
LDIKTPFTGWHSEASNLAPYVEKRTVQLFVSGKGDLLGKNSSSGAGFLFYFIPAGGKTVEWTLWRKLASTPPYSPELTDAPNAAIAPAFQVDRQCRWFGGPLPSGMQQTGATEQTW